MEKEEHEEGRWKEGEWSDSPTSQRVRVEPGGSKAVRVTRCRRNDMPFSLFGYKTGLQIQ
nr:hypothetical protein Iba_chr10aCG9130 [Ipomoea batatas]